MYNKSTFGEKAFVGEAQLNPTAGSKKRKVLHLSFPTGFKPGEVPEGNCGAIAQLHWYA